MGGESRAFNFDAIILARVSRCVCRRGEEWKINWKIYSHCFYDERIIFLCLRFFGWNIHFTGRKILALVFGANKIMRTLSINLPPLATLRLLSFSSPHFVASPAGEHSARHHIIFFNLPPPHYAEANSNVRDVIFPPPEERGKSSETEKKISSNV